MERVRYGFEPGWEAVAVPPVRIRSAQQQRHAGQCPSLTLAPAQMRAQTQQPAHQISCVERIEAGGAVRQDWCMSNRDRVRRNLHSYSPFTSVRAKPPGSGGYEPWSLKRTCRRNGMRLIDSIEGLTADGWLHWVRRLTDHPHSCMICGRL